MIAALFATMHSPAIKGARLSAVIFILFHCSCRCVFKYTAAVFLAHTGMDTVN